MTERAFSSNNSLRKKRVMKSAKFRQTSERSLQLSLRLLKKLRDAEWMVTHDWGGNRDEILEQIDALLDSKWAQAYLKEPKK
jgi:hypothetical protein